MLYNYASSSNTFELTATLEGKKPELKADFSPQKSKQDNGDTLVSLGTFEAENDQFSVTGITFTDLGTASLSGVSAISIYEDENKNGKVDSSDILLSQTSSVNSSDRTFTFSNFELFIDEGKQKKVLITYALASSASSSGLLVFVLIGLVIGSIFCSNKKSRYLLMLLFVSIVFGRCSGSGSSDYNPTIDNDSQLTATASGFGDQFSLQVGKPKSVADFFE